MKPLRTLVVVHSSLVPPATLEGYSHKEIAEWRTEYDVIGTLRKAGHTVQTLGVLDSLTELRTALIDSKPDVVFNLLEEFNGIVTYDQHVVAYLELMRQPYTGCNPRGLLLARDKVLCKQLLAFHRIPTPQFAVFRRGERFRVPRRLRFPLFVKSATEDASLERSPTQTVTTQTNHFFGALCGYIKLELLKQQTKLNHFALKSKRYTQAVRVAFDALHQLNPERLAA